MANDVDHMAARLGSLPEDSARELVRFLLRLARYPSAGTVDGFPVEQTAIGLVSLLRDGDRPASPAAVAAPDLGPAAVESVGFATDAPFLVEFAAGTRVVLSFRKVDASSVPLYSVEFLGPWTAAVVPSRPDPDSDALARYVP